jgi:hypothetical protein
VITREQAASLAPYRKSNINRFRAYFLDELRESTNINYQLDVCVAMYLNIHKQSGRYFFYCVILQELVLRLNISFVTPFHFPRSTILRKPARGTVSFKDEPWQE